MLTTAISTQAFQMAAAALATIRCAESRHGDITRRRLIQRALVRIRTQHPRHRHPRRRKQVIDMPAQGLLAPQMAGDARLESALRRTGIDVVPRRESELAEAADLQAQGVGEVDLELVGAWQGRVSESRSGRNVAPASLPAHVHQRKKAGKDAGATGVALDGKRVHITLCISPRHSSRPPRRLSATATLPRAPGRSGCGRRGRGAGRAARRPPGCVRR